MALCRKIKQPSNLWKNVGNFLLNRTYLHTNSNITSTPYRKRYLGQDGATFFKFVLRFPDKFALILSISLYLHVILLNKYMLLLNHYNCFEKIIKLKLNIKKSHNLCNFFAHCKYSRNLVIVTTSKGLSIFGRKNR